MNQVLLEIAQYLKVANRNGNSFDTDVTHKWQQMARTNLERQFSNAKDKSVIAKNVILFIGDGMSLGTITAARILKGQLDGDDADLEQNKEPYQAAEDGQLSFESFHHIALSKASSIWAGETWLRSH